MNTGKSHRNKISLIISGILLVNIFSLVCCSKPKEYRVGILSGLNNFAETTDGFKAGLTELGYIEGKNIAYDVQMTNFDMAVYDRILNKFVKDKVDLILVFPTEAAQQAKAVTEGMGIPVVFANAFIEGMGLVDSILQPGRNITGVRWPGPEIVANSFKIMLELVPHVKRILIPYQRGYPIVNGQLEILRKSALSANITLIEIPAGSLEELETELQKQTEPFNETVIQTIAEPLTVTPKGFSVLAKFAARYNIPITEGPFSEIDYQPVFRLIPEPIPQGRQAAYLADKIFKGTPAGKIPVLTAEYFFIFNYRQAEKLKLNITEHLLSQADQVIR